jgi:hypothetical protein
MGIEEQYHQLMHAYASTYMAMSFAVTGSVEFQALQKMGKSIIPFLLLDLNRTHEDWLHTVRTRTNMFDSWAIMLLLRINADNGPKFEEWMQGRHDAQRKVWLKWGQKNGYLPVSQNEERPGLFQRFAQWLGL